MTVKPGDRVRMTGLMDDPQPLAVGEEGTVEAVRNQGREYEQIHVRWDSGRTLMLLPHDPFTVVSAAGLTTDLFDQFARRDDFLGFGYVGGRRDALDGSDPESPAQPERVAEADAAIIRIATERGWTAEQLFDWANGKTGRWFADIAFGGGSLAQAIRIYL